VTDASAAAPPPVPPRPKARDSLAARLATAAVGIPLLLLIVLLAEGVLFALVIAAALAVGFLEYAHAMGVRREPVSAVGLAAVAALPLAAHWGDSWITATLVAATFASLVALVLAGAPPASLTPWALTVAGALYVGLLGAHFVRLHDLEHGARWVLFALFVTFATDTGAYAVGRLLGRHKLAPRLSPGKTVEGALGGLAGGALAAVGLNALLDLGQPVAAMLALGLAAAVAGQLGDLAESLIKRAAGVKDMGHLFPGHGGILDRLDSLLFVVPLVYYVARAWLV
jgi:phosphatidate cytidylyltransferase